MNPVAMSAGEGKKEEDEESVDAGTEELWTSTEESVSSFSSPKEGAQKI